MISNDGENIKGRHPMEAFVWFYLAAALALVAYHGLRGTLDETVACLGRHWLPFLAFFFAVCRDRRTGAAEFGPSAAGYGGLG